MATPFAPFPKDFVWGVATAAYQVEGAVDEDGRAPSVWDTFCRRPGAIAHGSHRRSVNRSLSPLSSEDVALMKELGVKAYRFSVILVAHHSERRRQGRTRKASTSTQRLIDELLAAAFSRG